MASIVREKRELGGRRLRRGKKRDERGGNVPSLFYWQEGSTHIRVWKFHSSFLLFPLSLFPFTQSPLSNFHSVSRVLMRTMKRAATCIKGRIYRSVRLQFKLQHQVGKSNQNPLQECVQAHIVLCTHACDSWYSPIKQEHILLC